MNPYLAMPTSPHAAGYHALGAPGHARKVRRWPWAAGGVLVGLILGVGIAGAGGGNTAAPATAPVYAPAAPVQAAPAELADKPSVEGIGDGIWEVGVDLQPGKYKTAGPEDNALGQCYFSRLETGDGSIGDIIANNLTEGPATVTIKSSDGMFESKGCQPWQKTG
jgi:hypothetical protein